MIPLTQDTDAAASAGPRFSVVTAVYNVARYLEDFIASIEAQTFPHDRFEVVAVDDGSTDESHAILEAWAARSAVRVTVLTKENGGQSTARNLGLEHARGEWITFTDPDDLVNPGYLTEVDTFLAANPTTSMIGTKRLMLNDATGEVTDTHPLRAHFRGGPRLRDLARCPDFFQGSAPASFFLRTELERTGLRFADDVRPNFEDGHFCSHYLLGFERPAVGFVSTAEYSYRKRSDSTSTLQNSLGNPDRYTLVLRNGYLDVLRRGAGEAGTAPVWLQNFIIYELSWYLRSEVRLSGAVTGAKGAVGDEYHELMGQIVGYLSDDVIASYWVTSMPGNWRQILMHSYRGEGDWHQEYGVLTKLDRPQELVRLVYTFTGEPPVEEFFSDGEDHVPEHTKIRDLEFHGRVLLHERVVWLPADRPISMRLDGRHVPLEFGHPDRIRYTVRPSGVRANLNSTGKADRIFSPKVSTERAARLVRRLSRTSRVRREFKNAWVLMDRIHDADDSGELLFTHLREKRPEINAWFVIEQGTRDWDRLRQGPHRKRVIAHGSQRWKLLMLNAQHLISSHADQPVIAPPAIVDLVKPQWRFTFLQHGVIKDDLSNWLSPKPIDLFVTSTAQEQESIAGDHTSYTFTSKEAKLTGLPRFDRLREFGLQYPAERRDLVLLAPTWRNWLLPPLESGSQERRVYDEFFDSDFVRRWQEVLTSPELRGICEAHGLKVGFLPHPNLQAAVPHLDLPDHVVPLTFTGNNVQELFARAAVLVTDYSSMAFNAAYLDRPVVYFQFDADRVLGGEHVGRKGYFEYERDGFGPVTPTPEAAVTAVGTILEEGRAPAPLYQERIDTAFPHRDGRCCERITDEVLRSTIHHRSQEQPRSSPDGIK